jgi:hypothetical protein
MNGTTMPEGGAGAPPMVTTRPEPGSPDLGANRKRLLADLQTLIAESQALQQELRSAPADVVSTQSLKHSQKIETLAKKIRKAVKLN